MAYLDPTIIDDIIAQVAPGGLIGPTAILPANHMTHGLHDSTAEGAGLDFSQYRPYVPGDDLRHFDWRLLARSNTLACRIQTIDKHLPFAVFIDASVSMDYRGTAARLSKFDYAASVAQGLLSVAHQQGDTPQLFPLSETCLSPVATGIDAVRQLLLSLNPQGRLSLPETLESRLPYLSPHRDTFVILISDFLPEASLWSRVIDALAGYACDIVAIQLLDHDELTLPFDTPRSFADPSSELRITGHADDMRQEYLERLHRHLDALAALFTDRGIRYWRFDTGERPRFS